MTAAYGAIPPVPTNTGPIRQTRIHLTNDRQVTLCGRAITEGWSTRATATFPASHLETRTCQSCKAAS